MLIGLPHYRLSASSEPHTEITDPAMLKKYQTSDLYDLFFCDWLMF